MLSRDSNEKRHRGTRLSVMSILLRRTPMRRNFADVLRSSGVDCAAEYFSLHNLLFRRFGLYSLIELRFDSIWFRDTTVSLRDFNQRHSFFFEDVSGDEDIDDLLDLCEYVYNFASALLEIVHGEDYGLCVEAIDHVERLVDKLDYVAYDEDGLTVFVPRNDRIIAAAEVAPEDVASDLVKYDYRGLEGDLPGKRAILLRVCNTLEPKREKLKVLSKGLENDLFFLANNLNIRHNNTDPSRLATYRAAVAQMGDGELEGWYDSLRGMCAASFLLLSYAENEDELKRLKTQMRSDGPA